jgi:hypothetical protein
VPEYCAKDEHRPDSLHLLADSVHQHGLVDEWVLERLHSGRGNYLLQIRDSSITDGYWLGLSGAYCPADAVREYPRVADMVLWAE